ncbi:hypothetical protein ES703_87370 [subsurface metagenome]
MPIKILRDPKGKILATVEHIPNPLIQVELVPSEGDKIELDIKAPENYEFDLDTFYKKI